MKRFVCLFAFSLNLMLAFAQQEVGVFSIQPKIGLNVANVSNVENIYDIEKQPRFGLAAGAEAEYQIDKRFSVSLGLIYSMQGAKAKTFFNGISISETDKIDYVNIPIMANFYLFKGFAIKVGLQPGIKVYDSYKLSVGIETEENIKANFNVSGESTDLGIKFNSLNFSIPIGISYEHYQVVIDARYIWGRSYICTTSCEQNRVFQFTVGYKFK